MGPFVRLLSVCVLTALMVSLSAAQGLMRGPDQAGQMTVVICTGHGPQVITLDAQGAPVAPAPSCPETQIVSLAADPVLSGLRLLGEVSQSEPALLSTLWQRPKPSWATAPRGPPFRAV